MGELQVQCCWRKEGWAPFLGSWCVWWSSCRTEHQLFIHSWKHHKTHLWELQGPDHKVGPTHLRPGRIWFKIPSFLGWRWWWWWRSQATKDLQKQRCKVRLSVNFIPLQVSKAHRLIFLPLKHVKFPPLQLRTENTNLRVVFFLQKVTEQKYFIVPVPWAGTWISTLLWWPLQGQTVMVLSFNSFLT